MTSDPVIVAPDVTVAEALARVRNPELQSALAAQVFVAEPPMQTPTGTYRGTIGFQRLLREPPSRRVAMCLEMGTDPVGPELPELEVARRLAAYDLLALPVCDGDGRLLGAVTVDDVLDRTLPADWRQR
jgi:Mg/Co/Ni transporter MgtE